MIWKLIFNVAKFMKECKEDKINAYAAQSAFFILLAIIPFLMVFLSLLKYTPITESMLLALYEEGLPGYISPFFISITDEIYTRSFGITAVSAIVAIWSAAKGMHALTDGLNAVNDLEENRNWFVLRFWSAIYTVVFMVAIVFTVLPNKKVNFISQLPGAVLCALSWNVISFLLSVYINYFNGFSMYGSLTTVALMMLWLYFCIYSTLMCAEFNVTFGDNLKKWVNRHRKI